MNILLTNDDGYFADGIKEIYQSLKNKYRVIIIAPSKEQSGVGHSFTYNKSLFFEELENEDGSKFIAVDGTPSDCIKLGLGYFKNIKPDIIISGINKGINSGIASFYSGTVAGAREAAFWRLPSIAFSLDENGFKYLKEYSILSVRIAEIIIKNFIKDYKNIFFNVNFPSCNPENVKGIRITKQSLAYYYDKYDLISKDGNTTEVLLKGDIKEIEKSLDFDTKAVVSGFVSITPLHFNNSCEDTFTELKKFEYKF